MNTKALAPVFLDDQPVELTDARPKVSAILAAGGKPDATQVKWLKSSSDTLGKSLRSEEVVDREAEPNKPIYLTSGAKGGPKDEASRPASGTGEPKGWQARKDAPAATGPAAAPSKGDAESRDAMTGAPTGAGSEHEDSPEETAQLDADRKAREAYGEGSNDRPARSE